MHLPPPTSLFSGPGFTAFPPNSLLEKCGAEHREGGGGAISLSSLRVVPAACSLWEMFLTGLSSSCGDLLLESAPPAPNGPSTNPPQSWHFSGFPSLCVRGLCSPSVFLPVLFEDCRALPCQLTTVPRKMAVLVCGPTFSVPG